MNREHEIAQAIEDEMSVTWDRGNLVHKLPEGTEIKKKYYERPYRYQDVVEIWVLTNGQFVVYYSPTGAMHLFDTWVQALRFRKSRVGHLRTSYKAWK